MKTCPFCGKPAVLVSSRRFPRDEEESVIGYSVICNNYDCPIYCADNAYYLSKEEAVQAWDARV